jgi:O-antigen/teichoic acid export membrane protein
MSRTAGSSMAWGGALSFARLISGLIRVKIVALALGVGGVGVFSLLQQVNLTGISIVGMSLAIPIINLGRPRVKSGTPEAAGRVAGTALALVALNGLILILVAAVAGGNMLLRIGTGALDPLLVWAIVLSILFGAVASSFWEGMSYLSDRFDIYVRAGIASALVDMLCVATGAWLYGLRGAVAAMPAGPLVLFGSYALLLSRDPTARKVLRHLSVRGSKLPQLLTYSAMMFAAVALTNVGLTAMRSRVLIEAGAAANGYLQTTTSLSAYILAFVTTGFWGHLHARAAAEGDTAEVRAELHQALRLGLLISFTGCGTALVLADYLIPLFFARQFAAAAPLMIAYMPGELCYQLLFLMTAYQLTISRRRRYLAWSVGYIGLLAGAGAAVIPRYGPAGYVAAHIAGAVIMLVVAGFISWRSGQVPLKLLATASSLAALLAVMSALLIWLHLRGPVGPIVLLGLIPVGVAGAMAAKELLSGFMLARRKPAGSTDLN